MQFIKFFRDKPLLLTVVSIFTVALFCLSVPKSQPMVSYQCQPNVNLIQKASWQSVPGLVVSSDKISVKGLGREISGQAIGNSNQKNPPLNLEPQHLNKDRSFTLNVSINAMQNDQTARFYIYSELPNIYDEWRWQPPGLELDIQNNKITVLFFNGRQAQPFSSKSFELNENPTNFKVTNKGHKLRINVNGHENGMLKSNDNLFSDAIWLGIDTDTGSSINITNMTLETEEACKNLVSPGKFNPSPDSLRVLSTKGSRKFDIGTAVTTYQYLADPAYQAVALGQFNQITPENELKPQFIHPQRNVYSFGYADSIVALAKVNNQTIHGHTLVFSEANPQWMLTSSLDERKTIMTEHIDRVMRHFSGDINQWDVVNEPLDEDTDGLRKNIWYEAMGEQYIDVAMRTARTASPEAKLFINEYGLEQDGPRWDSFIALMQRLQKRGVPIDGVGFQAHIHEPEDEINTEVLRSHIELLGSMGIKSRISELDVYGDSDKVQSEQYLAVVDACLNSPSCLSVTMWGFTDKFGSTTEIEHYPLGYGNDLLWDFRMQPKSVYFLLQKRLINP